MTQTCTRCNAPLAEGARFCQNCGTSLYYATPEVKDRSINFLLILLGFRFVSAIVWLMYSKFIFPLITADYSSAEAVHIRMRNVNILISGLLDGTYIVLAVVFAMLSKNSTVRIALLIFAFLELLFFVQHVWSWLSVAPFASFQF